MIDLIISFFSALAEEYSVRQMLRTVVFKTRNDIRGDIRGDSKDGYKQLVAAYKKTKKQLVLRQIAGVVGMRSVDILWDDTHATGDHPGVTVVKEKKN